MLGACPVSDEDTTAEAGSVGHRGQQDEGTSAAPGLSDGNEHGRRVMAVTPALFYQRLSAWLPPPR